MICQPNTDTDVLRSYALSLSVTRTRTCVPAYIDAPEVELVMLPVIIDTIVIITAPSRSR